MPTLKSFSKFSNLIAIVGGVIAAILAMAIYKSLVDTKEILLDSKLQTTPAGAITLKDLLHKDKEAFEEINSALGTNQTVTDGYRVCLDDLHKRLNGVDVPNRGQDHKWSLVLTVISRGGVGVVTGVERPEGSSWPPHFDEDAKDCYTNLVLDQQFTTSHDFAYKLAWDYCVVPSSTR